MTDIVGQFLQRYPQDPYLHYHAPRFQTLLALLRRYYRPGDRVLDIGRSRLTDIISGAFAVPVDSLGFSPDSRSASGNHYHFDLNDAQWPNRWRRDLGPYQVVVVAEVVEHLHTSPNLVLAFLNSITAPGGRVILQTPNAVALHKRAKMLLGRNPFEKIRESVEDPGHFREYTRAELVSYAGNTGFAVSSFQYGNYFDYRYSDQRGGAAHCKPHLKLFNHLFSICPGSLKPGMTSVLTKEGPSPFPVAG